jgi:hydroxymethylbilane synthase
VSARTLRIGTRGSALALWQARWVEQALRDRVPELGVRLEVIKTTGDRILDAPLAKIGDKGLFTREIELALLRKDIDCAVHSLKDLPTQLPDGLAIGAVSAREDVRDAFIPHPQNPVRGLLDQPRGVTVATGSLRRRAQLLHARPDLAIMDIRGNLQTRLRKLEESSWAGMLLAHAGVVRLGLEDRIGEILPTAFMLPAVGQGALAIEIRADDASVREIVALLHDEPTARATAAERAFLARMEGGCQIPIGTHARMETPDGTTLGLVLDALVGSLDGTTVLRGTHRGTPEHAERIGRELAEELLGRGAGDILRAIRHEAGPAGDESQR